MLRKSTAPLLAVFLSAQSGQAATVETLVSGGPITLGSLTLSNFTYRNIAGERATDVVIDAADIGVTTQLVTADPNGPLIFGEYEAVAELTFDFGDLTIRQVDGQMRWINELRFDVDATDKVIGLLGVRIAQDFNYSVFNADWSVLIQENGTGALGASIRQLPGGTTRSALRTVDPAVDGTNVGWRARSDIFAAGSTGTSTFGGMTYSIYYREALPDPDPDPVDPVPDTAVVPLPAGLPLMATALLGLLLARRQRQT